MRHTDVGDRVRLTAHRVADCVEIGVQDDGVGIDPGDLNFIFEGFRSGGPRPGTGMGLAITKAIAEAHGGTVDAQSPPGGGTRIGIRLPVDGPGASATRSSRDRATYRTPGGEADTGKPVVGAKPQLTGPPTSTVTGSVG